MRICQWFVLLVFVVMVTVGCDVQTFLNRVHPNATPIPAETVAEYDEQVRHARDLALPMAPEASVKQAETATRELESALDGIPELEPEQRELFDRDYEARLADGRAPSSRVSGLVEQHDQALKELYDALDAPAFAPIVEPGRMPGDSAGYYDVRGVAYLVAADALDGPREACIDTATSILRMSVAAKYGYGTTSLANFLIAHRVGLDVVRGCLAQGSKVDAGELERVTNLLDVPPIFPRMMYFDWLNQVTDYAPGLVEQGDEDVFVQKDLLELLEEELALLKRMRDVLELASRTEAFDAMEPLIDERQRSKRATYELVGYQSPPGEGLAATEAELIARWRERVSDTWTEHRKVVERMREATKTP